MAEEDCLPPSFCSIEELPMADAPVETGSNYGSSHHLSSKKDKSVTYLSDRFFPVRKMPCSAKELFNDKVEWMEEEEKEGENSGGKDRKGLTVKDFYKMEVLGNGAANRDNEIETFSNENFLRYKYFFLELVTRMRIDPKMTRELSSRKEPSSFLMSISPSSA